MRPLLLIDNYVDDPGGAGFFLPWLGGVPVEVVRPVKQALPDPADVRGVVVTGSRASVLDGEPWMDALLTWLGAAVRDDVPVLGVCFGHQALAAAVHGPAMVTRRPVPEVGFAQVQLDPADPLLSALGERVHAFVSHEDEVVADPRLHLIGSTDLCATQAFRVPGRRAWGLQFHLEYPPDEVRSILEYRRDRHPELSLDPELAMRTAPDTSVASRAVFARFLELC